jgi:hypothetical protein
MACGAQVAPHTETEKKKKRKKETSVIKNSGFIIAVLLIACFFCVFGDDIVPEKVRNPESYYYVLQR